MFQSGPIQVDSNKEIESVWGEAKGRISARDGRSFKEVVEGLPQNPKTIEWGSKNTNAMACSNADEYSRWPEEVHCEGVVSRWVE